MTTSFPVIVVKKYVKKAYLALTFERAVTGAMVVVVVVFNYFNIYALTIRHLIVNNAYRFSSQQYYFMALLFKLTVLPNRTNGNKNSRFLTICM